MDTTESPSPQIHKHFERPNFSTPTPEEIAASLQEVIFAGGGKKIAKLSPTLQVKFGDDVQMNEAKVLNFIAEHTAIPVTKVYAVFDYGPFDRDEEEGRNFDTYITMDHIEGQSLEKAWDTLDGLTKSTIIGELEGYLAQLRAIPVPDDAYVSSLDNGPVKDTIEAGPFASVEDFHLALVDAYCKIHKGHVKGFMAGMIGSNKHNILFVHVDFRPANIIVKDGHVAGIIDWELAGWYPEYWEFVKAFYVFRWQNDWGTRLLGIMRPYFTEWAWHQDVSRMLL